MDLTTPFFNALAWQTLADHEAAVDQRLFAMEGTSEVLPEDAYDHAVYAFAGIHPHWRLELAWAGDAERDFYDSFDSGPSDW